MNNPDPFDMGFVSVDEIKNCFTEFMRNIEGHRIGNRWDLAIEDFENYKYRLIDRCAINRKLFRAEAFNAAGRRAEPLIKR